MDKKPSASIVRLAETVLQLSEFQNTVSGCSDAVLGINVPVLPRDEVLMGPPDEPLCPEELYGGLSSRNARRLDRKPKHKKRLF